MEVKVSLKTFFIIILLYIHTSLRETFYLSIINLKECKNSEHLIYAWRFLILTLIFCVISNNFFLFYIRMRNYINNDEIGLWEINAEYLNICMHCPLKHCPSYKKS